MSCEINCKLFAKSRCLSRRRFSGFLDFLLLLFLYQDKKSKHKRKEILLFRNKPNKIFKHLLSQNITAQIKSWNGSVSTDWNNASNWTASGGTTVGVPIATDEVHKFQVSYAFDNLRQCGGSNYFFEYYSYLGNICGCYAYRC